jgi:hypothetical protein
MAMELLMTVYSRTNRPGLKYRGKFIPHRAALKVLGFETVFGLVLRISDCELTKYTIGFMISCRAMTWDGAVTRFISTSE